MIKKIQVLWYLNKEDLENYCIDFKEYKSHKLEGYEICDVDEDLIYDLCDIDCDNLEPLGYFKNKKELENYIEDYVTQNEFELNLDSPELKEKINDSLGLIEFDGEDYYVKSSEKITSWFKLLKNEYSKGLRENLWVLAVTGYDPYELSLTGKTLSYILADILNINESSLDNFIPNKGRISVEEWNSILDKVYDKNKIFLGLNRVV